MLQSIERAQPTGEWVVVSRYALMRKTWRNANHQIGELVLISPLISRLAPEIGIDSARNTRVFLARSSEIGDRRSFYGPWAVMESLRNPERTRTRHPARWRARRSAYRHASITVCREGTRAALDEDEVEHAHGHARLRQAITRCKNFFRVAKKKSRVGKIDF